MSRSPSREIGERFIFSSPLGWLRTDRIKMTVVLPNHQNLLLVCECMTARFFVVKAINDHVCDTHNHTAGISQAG
jgi:hypothetical protein